MRSGLGELNDNEKSHQKDGFTVSVDTYYESMGRKRRHCPFIPPFHRPWHCTEVGENTKRWGVFRAELDF